MVALVQVLIGSSLQAALYTLGAFGLSLSFGVLRIMNLSHGDLLMLGGFAGYFAFVRLGLNPFLSAAVVGAAAFFAGLAYHAVLLARITRGSHRSVLIASVMVTLGTALLIEDTTAFLWGGAPAGIPYRLRSLVWGTAVIPLLRLVLLASALVLTVSLYYFLKRTFLGRAVVASTLNRDAALVVGIDIRRLTLFTFGLGVALAAGSGVFYATLFTIEPYMGLGLTLKYLAILVVGGVGSLPGTFVGSLIIATAEAVTAYYAGPHWSPMVAFTILLSALLVRPQGLLGQEA